MAFTNFNYQADPYVGETEEERKRRLEAAAAADEAVAGGGATRGPVSYGDIFSQYADQRLGQAQNRIAQAGQYFTDPEEALRNRLGMQQQQVAAEEATPVKQTITTNPVTGEQTMKIEGSVRDLSAANPNTPTVTGPAVPTVEREVQQPVAQMQQPVAQMQQPVAPRQLNVPAQMPSEGMISSQAANMPVPQMNVPQPGPAVQVASAQPNLPATQPTQPVTPQQTALAALPTLAQMGQAAQAQQAQPNIEDVHQQAIISARNEQDPMKRREAYAKLLADSNVSEGNKAMANRFIAEDYMKQRDIQKANQAIQEASPTDLARYMKEKSKEGSYVKAILLARLGLNELAQKEQELIDPTITMASAVDSEGKKYTVGRDKNGNITTGFDTSGRQVGQEKLADLSAAAMPTKAHLLPSAHGGPVQRTNEKGEVEGGIRMYDPQTQSSYVLVGNRRLPDIGWTTPTQTVQNVFGAAQAGEAGKAAGQGFTPSPLQAFPGQQGGAPASYVNPQGNVPTDAAAVARVDRDIVSLQNTINAYTKRPDTDPVRQAQRMNILNDEMNKLQATKQGMSGAVQGLPTTRPAVATNAPTTTANMPVWQQKQNATLGEAAAKENIQVAGKRSESFNKILDEEVRPQAQAGDTVSSVRKQQFAIFDRPGVDSNKLFGLYNAAQENPNDQKLSIVRDIFGGAFKPEAEVSQRLALLNLTPQEKSALIEYNISNQRINAATLKQTAGPGSVSDAEQRANRESNVDPTKVPALGAYNAMAQSQFNGDLARYKADWAENHPATNALQLDKAWRKESSSLSEVYGNIAKQRAQYIAGNGATTAAVREGYRKFPIPEYDPNTGTWKKTKPLAEILGR